MFYKFIALPILLSSFLFSGIVLDIGTVSQGNGTYDDGEMYDAYETHPYEITNQIAETILQPLPEAPYEENGNWMYGGEVITEEDATAIKVYITDLKAKREKYFNDGWRLYLPDEKLLLDEAKVYLNTFQNMWGDQKIQNIVKEKNIDKLKRSPLEYWLSLIHI